MRMQESVLIEVMPRRLGLVVPRGSFLLRTLAGHGLVLDGCGGLGQCRRCRVRWLSSPPQPTSAEVARMAVREIDAG